jgi:2-polyprenyl-6-methoxyphenol hydroxylase-like FAD-dependent oxidoreductase
MLFSGSARLRVIVIGAGIAGPAVALFLKRLGADVTVFEAHGPCADIGAALGVAPNGMTVLDHLGLADAVVTAGSPIERFEFQTGNGRRLGTMAYAPRGRYRFTGISLGRPKLNAIMTQALHDQGVSVVYNKRLSGITQDARGVLARFTDGGEVWGDILVGADGIRSAVRALAMPAAPNPAFTGLVGCGGFVPRSVMRNVLGPDRQTTMGFAFGRAGFFGYALGDQTEEKGAYWWNALPFEHPPNRSEREALSGRAGIETFLASDPHWSGAVRTIVEATTHPLGPFDLYDVATLPRWWSERVVLMGDAAHAVSPHAGQGASMALEDAIVLAKVLRDNENSPQAAFRAYEANRRPRAEKVVAEGRRNGDQKKKGPLAGPIQQMLMPLLLKLAPAQRDLYGYDPGWND